MVRGLSGFRWSAENVKTGLLYISMIAVVFCGFYVLPPLFAFGVGTVMVVVSGIYSIRVLLNLIDREQIPLPAQRILMRFGLARARS